MELKCVPVAIPGTNPRESHKIRKLYLLFQGNLQSYLRIHKQNVQAYRQTAPSDLSLNSYWGYPKDMEWVTILAIKFAFIVAFEVGKSYPYFETNLGFACSMLCR